MTQIARNLTDGVDGFFTGNRYLIHDRDPLYTWEFLSVLAEGGYRIRQTANTITQFERVRGTIVRTIKDGCLERMIFFGEDSLRKAIREFVEHYHTELNHQGLGHRLIIPLKTPAETTGTVQSRERLGGMLNYYYREAA